MTSMKLFNKVLIANRSEIACRIMQTCRDLGIRTVAVYSDADTKSRHRMLADESVHLGAASPRESYLNIEKLITAAKQTGAEAIHPGYGFLAENPLLPEACEAAGIVFIGPTAAAMRLMGNKVGARQAMLKAGVPMTPGMQSSSVDQKQFAEMAEKVGYPVLIKAAAGGGGKGMRVVHQMSELADAISAAQREAKGAFGDASIYLEKYIAKPRHIEFQVLGDTKGNVVHLFERECSIQRRHQKIIEETPSVALTPALREKMGAAAVAAAKAANYTSAGTIEFLLDQSGEFYFLEMNTRIQVEHPITEMTTGVDLVYEQLRIAAGHPMSEAALSASQTGHAIECRMYAEDGENGFLPSTGKLTVYREPSGPGIRVDSGVMQHAEITIDYDPIMAKLIVHAPNRDLAIERMIRALHDYKILGVRTSKRYLVDILEHPEFRTGHTYTNFIADVMTERASVPSDLTKIAAAASLVPVQQTRIDSAGTEQQDQSLWSTLGEWEIGTGREMKK
jgi:acetyl-CoA carboxylase biotin carboxylase subunit